MPSIAMIGLGNMGSRMGGRLRDAGHVVHGSDVVDGRAAQLGLEPAAGTGAATAAADIVLLSLPSDAAIATAMAGPDGVIGAARPGQLVIDLSTATPGNAARWERELEARGAAFLDAGISGGPGGADAGTLTLMVGGRAELIERAQGVFDVIGSRVFHCGAAGAGHATKVVNNYLNGMNLAATAEALVVGVKAGLDPRQLLEVINASTGANWASEHRFPRIVEGDYIEGGLTNALMAKDLDLYLGLADALDVPAALGAACRTTFTVAMATGYRDRVSNTVVDAIGDLAGGVRVQPDGDRPKDTT
ncbi:NAD(P)-dependent oxidoreductase [Baekduia soli]|uniref:NAD(P)-dependent oxidoreductase n=2 Tax=Baekduia soli TaxID=496014 RepID=A0A5B8UCK7_9ACTN|nr:NAD(P)-dependent oxidoreductase [Baekduia soli]